MKKIAFNPRTMDILKRYAQPAGIGAGIGALGMGASSLMSDDPEERQPSGLMKSMLMGAGLGGATGAGIRAGADYMKPSETSPEGLNAAAGNLGKLPSSHWAKTLLRPFASEDHGGSFWGAQVPASATVGAGAQLAANKYMGAPTDISKVTTPNLTFKHHNPADPYFQKYVLPKQEAAFHQQATTPGKRGPGGGGKTQFDSTKFNELSKAWQAANTTGFEAEVAAVKNLKGTDGSLNRQGMGQLAGHSSRTTDDVNKPWNPTRQPAQGKPWSRNNPPVNPANEDVHRIRQALGNNPGGADVAGNLSLGQKFRAALQNPMAHVAARFLPEKHVFGEAPVDARLDKYVTQPLRKTLQGWSNKAQARSTKPNDLWNDLSNQLKGITPAKKPVKAMEALPPRYVQPSEMKGITGISTHPTTGHINRYSYTPESANIKAVMTGKTPASYGRGKWAVGPAAAAAAFGAGSTVHDRSMDQAIQELWQSGPQAQMMLRNILQEVQQKQQGQQGQPQQR